MKCGLLGRTLRYSFSPEIHAFYGDYEYRLFEVEPEELSDFIRSGEWDGLNVTIPYKRDVIPFCGTLTTTAREIGSVNTIVRLPDGSLLGDNTDYFGFRHLLSTNRMDACGKKAVVLGDGGASLTVRCALSDAGAREAVAGATEGPCAFAYIYDHLDAEIVVNTTPVGTYPDVEGTLPFDLVRFTHCSGVVDLTYNPLRTNLLLSAKSLGIPYAGGLTMLTAQAFRSSELFTGSKLDEALIGRATETITQKMRNIVLVGMPGSGKSTIAQELSRRLGREAVDTDSLVEAASGTSIPDIFAREGETAFRKREEAAVREVSALRGAIVSVGGGAVLSGTNRDALMRTGVIVHLTRELDKLSTDGRPLSAGADALMAMEKARAPIYEGTADITVAIREDDVPATVDAVIEGLYAHA